MKKKEKKIVLFAMICLLVGFILIFIAHSKKKFESCLNRLNSEIEKKQFVLRDQFRGKDCAIYLVDNVSTCCRPLFKFKQILEKESFILYIFVNNDFSDIDIENFRLSFNIPCEIEILRKDAAQDWLMLLELCNYQDDGGKNLLIILGMEGLIQEVATF